MEQTVHAVGPNVSSAVAKRASERNCINIQRGPPASAFAASRCHCERNIAEGPRTVIRTVDTVEPGRTRRDTNDRSSLGRSKVWRRAVRCWRKWRFEALGIVSPRSIRPDQSALSRQRLPAQDAPVGVAPHGNRVKEVPDSIVAPKVGEGFFSTENKGASIL